MKRQKARKTGRKHCGKRRNCLLQAISPFPTVFSKDLYGRHVKTRALGKGKMAFLGGKSVSQTQLVFFLNQAASSWRRISYKVLVKNNIPESMERGSSLHGITEILSKMVFYPIETTLQSWLVNSLPIIKLWDWNNFKAITNEKMKCHSHDDFSL